MSLILVYQMAFFQQNLKKAERFQSLKVVTPPHVTTTDLFHCLVNSLKYLKKLLVFNSQITLTETIYYMNTNMDSREISQLSTILSCT